MEIRIREIAPADRQAWCQLRAMLWPEQTAEQHAEEVTLLERAGQLPLAFVAEDESGALVGFLELVLRHYAPGCKSSPVPFVEGWFVMDSHRGQGIGGLLVEMAERWALANSFHEIASDSVIDNSLSEVAHRAAGFREVERLICWHKDLRE